jgi:hypothetical protein
MSRTGSLSKWHLPTLKLLADGLCEETEAVAFRRRSE